jgi:hypothetical protein
VTSAEERCPDRLSAPSRWPRSDAVKVGDRRVCLAEEDLDRPVEGERLVRADEVGPEAVGLGVPGEHEAVEDVFAVEPLVFQ